MVREQSVQGPVRARLVVHKCSGANRELHVYAVCVELVLDVVNGTLDLVLSSSTHTDTVQTIAVAPKGRWFFL